MQKGVNKFDREQLRVIRKSKGLTQGEAAKQIGISKRSLARFEAGEGEPSESMLRLLLGFMAEDEAPPQGTTDPVELKRLRDRVGALERQQIAARRMAIEKETTIIDQMERIQELERHNSKLRTEIQALRAQVTAAALGPNEGQLMIEAGELLRMPTGASLEQILDRVVSIFSAAREETDKGDRLSVEPGPAGAAKKAGGA